MRLAFVHCGVRFSGFQVRISIFYSESPTRCGAAADTGAAPPQRGPGLGTQLADDGRLQKVGDKAPHVGREGGHAGEEGGQTTCRERKGGKQKWGAHRGRDWRRHPGRSLRK